MDNHSSRNDSTCFIPDEVEEQAALERTTHLGIGAHPDDLEVLALDGILTAFHDPDQWFTGITVTDGAGSVRKGPYSSCTDDELCEIRAREQRKAATIGEYSAVYQLGYESSTVRETSEDQALNEMQQIVKQARPDVVYTHTPADRHPTHVAVAMKALRGLQALPEDDQPETVYGVEVWRDLDWLPVDQREVFDLSGYEHLISALIGVYDSQIRGGKRYERALSGRQRAHATFSDPHEADQATRVTLGMDLTPIITPSGPEVSDLMKQYLQSFQNEVLEQMEDV